MATSSFSFDPGPIPLARQPYQIVCQRYLPQDTPGDPPATYQSLPNIYCLGVVKKEGEPRTARFRYVLSDLDDIGGDFPDGFEDLIGIDATSKYAVKVDDRINVSAISADTGKMKLLFDGYAQEPEGAITPNGQQVTFSAVGVEVRCWDVPIDGAAYRDATDSEAGTITQTDLPVRFNPTDSRGTLRPNATPILSDTDGVGGLGTGNGAYPVFVDPQIDHANAEDEDEEEDTDEEKDAAIDGDSRRPWTLGMAVRYLLWRPAAYGGNGDEQYVKNGDTTKLDDLFRAVAPTDGNDVMDLADDSTYDSTDIIVPDVDVSNKPWPVALKELLWPHGFRFKFALTVDGSGNPSTQIQFYRKDGLKGLDPKSLKLQQQGDAIDPGLSNVSTLRINRGAVRYNRVVIETDPVLYEVAVILPPGFTIASGDAATPAAMKLFNRGEWGNDFTNNQANRSKYRTFVYDECGDGHWDTKTGAWTTNPGGSNGIDFDAVFIAPANLPDRVYTRRYRPGRSDLISTENNQPLGKPLRCQLHVSKNYAGPTSGIWDGTGTWQSVTQGWRLLKNRLGFYVTIDNPNKWDIGTPPTETVQDQVGRNGMLNLIEKLAAPGTNGGLVYFRLTVAIESDEALTAVAAKRPASSTDYEVTARVDARDHFKKLVIDPSSPFNHTAGAKKQRIIPRDDTAKALAYAKALRAVNEQGHWAGSATIPRLSLAYDVGDRIDGVDGRTATFQTNTAGQVGESPTYPSVSGLTWNFEGGQTTTLEFSGLDNQPMMPA